MQFFAILALASAVSALSVTAPVEGSSIAQSSTLAITWSTVSTDQSAFNIELALATDSGNAQTLTTNVMPSTNGYSTPASAFAPGNYTVNLVATSTLNTGILAQSHWFLITAAAVASSARATSAAAASTIPAAAASSIASAARASGSASGVASAGASESSGAATSSTATQRASGADRKAIAGVFAIVVVGVSALLL